MAFLASLYISSIGFGWCLSLYVYSIVFGRWLLAKGQADIIYDVRMVASHEFLCRIFSTLYVFSIGIGFGWLLLANAYVEYK